MAATFAVNDSSVYSVSNTDLLQTNLSSVSMTGSIYSEFSGGLAAFNDGAFGSAGTIGASSVGFTDGSGSVTFSFNLTTSPGGYSLTEINTYAAWDIGRDGQAYAVSYSVVSAPSTFSTLYTLSNFNGATGGNGRTLVSLTDGSGVLATNVAALKFTFTDFENGGTAYREIDVIGTAIPEPAASPFFLGAVALALPMALRQARRRSAISAN